MREAPTAVTPGIRRNRSVSASMTRLPSIEVRYPRDPRVDLQRVHVLDGEAGVNGGRFLQRSQEQARRDEQEQRHRDLRGHHPLSQPGATSIRGRRGAVQGGRDIEARRLQRRQQREEHGGERRERKREPHHARIDAQLQRERNRNARLKRRQQRNQSLRNGHADARRRAARASDPRPGAASGSVLATRRWRVASPLRGAARALARAASRRRWCRRSAGRGRSARRARR